MSYSLETCEIIQVHLKKDKITHEPVLKTVPDDYDAYI